MKKAGTLLGDFPNPFDSDSMLLLALRRIAAPREFGRFSNRPFEVKHFQTIRHCNVDVAHGLALLFGIRQLNSDNELA